MYYPIILHNKDIPWVPLKKAMCKKRLINYSFVFQYRVTCYVQAILHTLRSDYAGNPHRPQKNAGWDILKTCGPKGLI